MLSKTDVSSLYVSLFGRASEGEGNTYWQSYDSLEAAAEAMLETEAAQDYFGDTLNDNEAFIESIYENTLNKTVEDDPDGIAYWTAQLDNGATKGEVTAQLVEAIKTYAPGAENYDPDDAATVYAYNQFENRVKISDVTADKLQTAPEDYDVSLSFNHDLQVTGDDDVDTLFSVEDQLAQKYGFEADHADVEFNPFEEDHGQNEIDMGQFGTEMDHTTTDRIPDLDGTPPENVGKYGAEMDHSTADGTPDLDGTPPENAGQHGKEIDHTQDQTLQLSDGTATLTEADLDSLSHMFQEEKLAMDVYNALGDIYTEETVFQNIADAEEQHLSSVESVMELYNVDMTSLDALAPGEFEDADLQALYDSLIESGSQSLEDALNVGVLVEETDIADLDTYLSDVTNPDIVGVYNMIEDGSYSHLDAFTQALDMV